MAVQIVDLVENEASSLKIEAQKLENLAEMASLARSLREQAGYIHIWIDIHIFAHCERTYTYIYIYKMLDFASKCSYYVCKHIYILCIYEAKR